MLRALKLGDLLCTVPAFRALRAALPDAEIHLVAHPWAREIVGRFDGYLDGLFELPGFPGFPEVATDVRAFPRFLDAVHAWGPDLVLQMHGSGQPSNSLAVLLGGKRTAGFFVPGNYCPDPEMFIPYPDDLPEVRRHLKLLAHLGIEPRGEHKELPLRPADEDALADLLDGEILAPGRYAVVHAGASVPERQWPAERFAAVADRLAERGLRIVLTGGPPERPIVDAVREAMAAPTLGLCGRTTLGTLGALLRDATILVSNDTGVMHVAEGVGAPTVAVTFDPESWRWAPRDAARHRTLQGGHAVTVDDVLAAAEQLLAPDRVTTG